jgi:UDP-N-acetylglucosamine--N-acetylmuramyl-(pentapeptide) pyrophosphoryl-undecaprenol N-acetylglucosamine transferase
VSTGRFALVTGGGTGGHVVPALAVARALVARHGRGQVELVGSRRGLDARLVQGTGLPVTLLPGRGLRRGIAPASVLANASALAQLAAACAIALVVVARRKPAVVVAIGGYACVPCALAAWLLGVPVVLVNVDAVPGAANRLVGRFAVAAAVASEGTALPRAVVTGVPLRDEIVAVSSPDQAARERARKELSIPTGRKVVGVVGGSLGAKRINEATVGLATMWRERSDVAVYHVVGRRDFEWARGQWNELSEDGLWYRQVEFEEQMPLFYEASDVVVCRAGAITVWELAAVGVPAVVVPLPGSPGDHQGANAAMLERAGAAIVVPDPECTPGRLGAELEGLLEDEARLASMRDRASSIGKPDAIDSVVALVEGHARPRAPGRGRRRAPAGKGRRGE